MKANLTTQNYAYLFHIIEGKLTISRKDIFIISNYIDKELESIIYKYTIQIYM
jgi:hypothetical protein